jgi:peptidoglycan/LPS O-acetylase OafA/YrhL
MKGIEVPDTENVCAKSFEQVSSPSSVATSIVPRESALPKRSQVNASIQHLRYIDSLRGIAVAGVIAVHLANLLHSSGLLGEVFRRGAAGVQLFFLVSALTLMMSMAKRNKLEMYPTLNFFIRRLFRIAPGFYIVVAAYCLLNWVTNLGIDSSKITFPQSLVVLSFLNGWRPDLINNAPVVGQWSIAVEMMFYLILPCIFPFVLTFRRAVVAWWISIAIYLIATPLAYQLASWEGFSGNPATLYEFAGFWFPNQLPVFLSGIGLYLIIAEKRSLWRSILPYLPGVILLALLDRFYHPMRMTPIDGVIGTICVVLVARLSPRILVNRFTAHLGKVSFSAYLCHPLILAFLKTILIRMNGLTNPAIIFPMLYGITLICVLAVSTMMWKLIERPGQNLGKRIIAHLAR